MNLEEIFDGKDLSPNAGIYCIWADNQIVYVGKNYNITSRLRNGHRWRNTPLWQAIQKHRPDSLKWEVNVIEVESENPDLLDYRMRAVEAEQIRKHEPYLNVAYNPAAWAERT